MIPFELVEPASLGEAISLLDRDDATVRPIAGGTALMLMMKAGVFRPTRLVSLRKLAALNSRIAIGKDGALTIGAMTPLALVERSPEVARAVPVIPRAMRRLSNIRVRNVATIGGNLAHGDPHMDLPPILIALRAEVTVVGPNGAKPAERTIAVEDLFAGYFETVLAKNGGQIRARRHQRCDREGDASHGCGTIACRRNDRREGARARRRGGGRGSRVHLGRARLRRL